MSKGYKKRENDSFPNQRGERKIRRNESKQPKPFTGFTSPYRRLNEQALMQKKESDSSHREKRFASHRNEPPSWENRRAFTPMTPTGHSSRIDAALSNKNFEHRFPSTSPYIGTAAVAATKTPNTDLRHYNNWRGEHEKEKYHSHSNINPWSDKYARQTENFINENKAMKRLNEESVYGKVSWEYNVPQDDSNCGKNYEKPMDPKEFREQCRRAYVRAAEERQRNAELSVWGKCDWATYDRYKSSRP